MSEDNGEFVDSIRIKMLMSINKNFKIDKS